MNCPNCNIPMDPVFDHPTASNSQVDNGLVIELSGYYGGFFDPMSGDLPATAVICHDCAVWLAREFPVFAKLLDAHAEGGHQGIGGQKCCDWSW